MKLHPRTQPVNAAAAYTRNALLDIQDEFELTDVEMLRILLEVAERVSSGIGWHTPGWYAPNWRASRG